jgi:CheY-like chemotaxis protein
MESVGFQVKVAENGRQGVELFQSWRPHFIWMDHLMPVMDGIEATKIIRGLPGGDEVKIVAVTASAFQEQREDILGAGMDDFVRKPYRAHEIYECLSRQLGVRYAYLADDKPAEAPMELAPEALSALPGELRRELEAALKSLESERIEMLIGQVARYDKELFGSLTHLAQNFDYPAILKALRTN